MIRAQDNIPKSVLVSKDGLRVHEVFTLIRGCCRILFLEVPLCRLDRIMQIADKRAALTARVQEPGKSFKGVVNTLSMVQKIAKARSRLAEADQQTPVQQTPVQQSPVQQTPVQQTPMRTPLAISHLTVPKYAPSPLGRAEAATPESAAAPALGAVGDAIASLNLSKEQERAVVRKLAELVMVLAPDS